MISRSASGQHRTLKVVLASKSASRRAMLDGAGIAYEVRPSDIDERAVERNCGTTTPETIATFLAEAKALAAPASRNEVVLGSDSLITVQGRRFDKPFSRDQAAEHLQFFSGKTLMLHSAAALARAGEVLWSHGETARLEIRALSSEFIAAYLDEEWPAVSHCVGAFRIEGLGVHLFERIEGSHFTILGMPLLPVLAALRALAEPGP